MASDEMVVDHGFYCFVPGYAVGGLKNFTQTEHNKWKVVLEARTPVNEVAAYISRPLPDGTALGCYISAGASDLGARWHYLGPITNGAPSAVFKTRYVWSAADAVPTSVQFGVVMEPEAQLAQTPPERVSAEVLEAGRRIGQDLYSFLASFAGPTMEIGGEQRFHLPLNVLERWLTKFNDKCQKQGLDWLKASEGG